MTNGAGAPDGENTGGTGHSEEMQSFISTLPENAQGLGILKRSPTPEAFWKQVVDQQSFIGNSLRIPTENAASDEREAFFQKVQDRVPELMRKPDMDDRDTITNFMQQIGMPSDATGYSDIKGDDIAFAEGQLESIKELAAQAGLTREQYEALAANIGKNVYEQQGEAQTKQEANLQTLKEEWGLAAEAKYQQTLEFAKGAGAPESLVSMLENKSADAGTVKWLNGLADKVGEGDPATTQPSGSPTAMTPYEAQQQINEILDNKQHPYHKSDARARAKMHDLMKQAKPDQYAS